MILSAGPRKLHARRAERGGCQAAVKPLRADAEFVKHHKYPGWFEPGKLHSGMFLRIASRQLQADSGAVEIVSERSSAADSLLSLYITCSPCCCWECLASVCVCVTPK